MSSFLDWWAVMRELAGRAHPKTLLALGQDHRRASFVGARGREGGVELAEVVAAALQGVDLGVGHALDERARIRVLLEELRSVIVAVAGAEILIFAVDGLGEPAQQHVLLVAGEQGVPVGAPEHLDHVPAGAGEQRLQLLDDLPVSAHRTIKSLKVAVDDEGQVVESFARRQRQRGRQLRLVEFAVPEHPPDPAIACAHEAAMLEIAHEAGLVDRIDDAKPHRPGRKLPEVGHEPGVRVG